MGNPNDEHDQFPAPDLYIDPYDAAMIANATPHKATQSQLEIIARALEGDKEKEEKQ